MFVPTFVATSTCRSASVACERYKQFLIRACPKYSLPYRVLCENAFPPTEMSKFVAFMHHVSAPRTKRNETLCSCCAFQNIFVDFRLVNLNRREQGLFLHIDDNNKNAANLREEINFGGLLLI